MDLEQRKHFLIDHLIAQGHLRTPRIIEAFRAIPREFFVPGRYREHAWEDEPIPLDGDQTISAPHMVAEMTELLRPAPTDKVLEIGTGSGYQAAILGRLVKKVYTVERVPQLVKFAQVNLKRVGIRNVKVILGDGSKGYRQAAPYSKIIMTCAAPEIPKALIEQLRVGGIFVGPIGGRWCQELVVGIKRAKGLIVRNYGSCMFVPLRQD